MKVLWLCSWYPNKLKPFDGDFIQRHAQAVSSLHHVYVIFIKKDEDGIITKEVKEETQTHNNLTETIVYYRPLKTGISFFDKVISNRKFKKLYKEVIGKYISVNGKPALVHVHVALKAGMLAVWLKKNLGFHISCLNIGRVICRTRDQISTIKTWYTVIGPRKYFPGLQRLRSFQKRYHMRYRVFLMWKESSFPML